MKLKQSFKKKDILLEHKPLKISEKRDKYKRG